MPNNFDSNFTNKLMRVFLEEFETARVLSTNVDTQLLSNAFDPSTGDTVFFKRPTDYTVHRDPTGDITSAGFNDIITGKASGIVQDYFTVPTDYDEADEAIKMDQISELLAPAASRLVIDLELDFAKFMTRNAGLLAGTFGTPVTEWDHVAQAGAVMQAHGVPNDGRMNYAINPFTQRSLASDQRSLGSGGASGEDIKSAHRRAIISDDFAGMTVMTSTALGSFMTEATGDRVGAINGSPDVTYVGAKDTMTQSIPVDGFGTFSGTIKAGEVIRITGRNRLNLSTREPMIDETGSTIEYTGVLVADAVLTSGAGTFIVSGPAIFESGEAFNTVDSALADDDVVTLLGLDSTLYQPNLFWHKQAYGIGFVPIKKLHSHDTIGTTKDGIQIRVTMGADFIKNRQEIRWDIRPAYSVLNPFFAGQGWG